MARTIKAPSQEELLSDSGASVKKHGKRSVGQRSKSKGKKAEKEFCELLDVWCNVAPKTFAPSRASGGWRYQKKSLEPGDVVSRYPETTQGFPFIIDIKNREKWDFMEWFSRRQIPAFLQWWLELEAEASQFPHLVPMLVITRNNAPFIVVTKYMDWEREFCNPLSIPWASLFTYPVNTSALTLVICSWDVFTASLSFERAKGVFGQ